jgi:hypothetical protein
VVEGRNRYFVVGEGYLGKTEDELERLGFGNGNCERKKMKACATTSSKNVVTSAAH